MSIFAAFMAVTLMCWGISVAAIAVADRAGNQKSYKPFVRALCGVILIIAGAVVGSFIR